ncbi:hypothetical protein PTQ27_00005, partial [Mannheimia sp. AT1]|nr:hypothetical protein [Mannheimia cairinae]MDD0826111.1 hypothetical protein [Mannheimia cairinae]
MLGPVAAANATSDRSVIIGAQVANNSNNDRNVLIGNFVNGNGFDGKKISNAVGIGSSAMASGNESIAIGRKAAAKNVNAIAIGTEAQATAKQSIAIGTGNLVNAENAGAIGDPSIVSGTGSYTLGNDNAVGSSSANTGAFGNNNQIGATATYDDNRKLQLANGLAGTVDATGSRVVGNNNAITSKDTYVLGSGINTGEDGKTPLGETVANSVYLGNDSTITAGEGSVTAEGKGTLFNALKNSAAAGATTTGGATGSVSSATVNTISYSTFAGARAVGAVSVGAAGAERRIQNVAAGEISATSTDAINGSQLYLTQDRLGNVANSVVKNFGGDAKLGQDGNITFTNIGNTGQDNIHDAISVSKVTLKEGANVTIESKELTNSTGEKLGTEYTVTAKDTSAHVKSADESVISVTQATETRQDGTREITDYTIDLSQEIKDEIAKEESVVSGDNNIVVTPKTEPNNTGGKEFEVTLANEITI